MKVTRIPTIRLEVRSLPWKSVENFTKQWEVGAHYGRRIKLSSL